MNVALLVSGDVWASVNNAISGNAQAWVEIVAPFETTGNQLLYEYVLADCCTGGLSISSDDFSDAITVTSGMLYDVYLNADLSIEGISLASANADPYIQIDPAFASANPGFSLEFSDGIDNAPITTPEPRSLALVGSVAAFSLFYVRRSKRRGLLTMPRRVLLGALAQYRLGRRSDWPTGRRRISKNWARGFRRLAARPCGPRRNRGCRRTLRALSLPWAASTSITGRDGAQSDAG